MSGHLEGEKKKYSHGVSLKVRILKKEKAKQKSFSLFSLFSFVAPAKISLFPRVRERKKRESEIYSTAAQEKNRYRTGFSN